MNTYQVWTSNQVTNDNWLLFDLVEEGSNIRIKPQYAHLYCPKCYKPHHEAAFRFGFEAGAKFRVRGHIHTTLDGFMCVHDVVRTLIENNKWTGLVLKQVPGTPWHVINVIHRVWSDPACYTYSNSRCPVCERVREVTGSISCLSEIAVPSTPGTFFATELDCAGSTNRERDIFITEDIHDCLKAERIKGAWFQRLASAEEIERNKKKWAKKKQAV